MGAQNRRDGRKVSRAKRAWFQGSPTVACHYCGGLLTRRTVTADHVFPISRGGARGLTNLVPCCRKCNQRRGAGNYWEFMAKTQALRERRAAA